jgi:hypothetical protein
VTNAPRWLLWVVAVLLMGVTAVYQRRTGPTYPVSGSVSLGGEEIKFSLPRSYDGPGDCEVRIPVVSTSIAGTMEFRRFRSNDAWIRQPMARDGDSLVAQIPHQPIAGKVMYRIELANAGQAGIPLTPEHLIIRFRNPVPIYVVLPHVLMMFVTLLFASRAGLEDLTHGAHTYRFALYTMICLAIGGLILGPMMQKYAFNAYWTGWPLGHDLTDNKTAAALLLWVIAFWRLKKAPQVRGWALAALVLTLVVYYIPHSVLGSELDYTQPTQ